MSMRTFVDASLLIAAARGKEPTAGRAFQILDDPRRVFVSSEFVRLEVLPKPTYERRQDEVEFHEAFFDSVAKWARVGEDLAEAAYTRACEAGLSAVDAFHVAAAESLNAEELVTGERPTKPLFRTQAVEVVSIHSPAEP